MAVDGERWEEQMLEQDSVVGFVGSGLEREAGEHAVVQIWKKWYIVSVVFFFILTFRFLTAGF